MEPRASTALTDVGLAALRRAAVMAHTVGIDLAAPHGGRRADRRGPARSDRPRPSQRARTIDPCGFRMAVARAWADHEMGREIGLIGLGPTDELDIEWSVAAPGPRPRPRRRPGRLRRAPSCGRSRRSSTPPSCPTSWPSMDGDHDDIVAGRCDGIAARLVHDELLGATVVHVEADPPVVDPPVLDEVLRRWSPSSGRRAARWRSRADSPRPDRRRWTERNDAHRPSSGRRRAAPPGCGDPGVGGRHAWSGTEVIFGASRTHCGTGSAAGCHVATRSAPAVRRPRADRPREPPVTPGCRPVTRWVLAALQWCDGPSGTSR